eukprot:6262745-Amphidinium_carterae.1
MKLTSQVGQMMPTTPQIAFGYPKQETKSQGVGKRSKAAIVWKYAWRTTRGHRTVVVLRCMLKTKF